MFSGFITTVFLVIAASLLQYLITCQRLGQFRPLLSSRRRIKRSCSRTGRTNFMRAQLITPDYPQPERGNSPPYIAETYMYLLRPASPHFASLEIPTSLPACRRTTTRPSRHRDYTMQYCTFAAAQLTRDPSAPSLTLALSLSPFPLLSPSYITARIASNIGSLRCLARHTTAGRTHIHACLRP
jgi:hypothetical protein